MIDVGFALYNLQRRRVHGSPALEQTLDQEPGRNLLERAILQMVRTVAELSGPSNRASMCSRIPDEHVVRTQGATYRLRGSFLERDLIGAASPLVLVEVERLNPDRPSTAELSERFDLTPREAEVALLLTERRSTEEIARTLMISKHTARHHIEKVFLKLGAHSRSEVSGKILVNCKTRLNLS